MMSKLTDMIREFVMNDVRPFVCLYQNCPKAGETYASKSAFRDHEQIVHGVNYQRYTSWDLFLHGTCAFCGGVLVEVGWHHHSRHTGHLPQEAAFTPVAIPYKDWGLYSSLLADMTEASAVRLHTDLMKPPTHLHTVIPGES